MQINSATIAAMQRGVSTRFQGAFIPPDIKHSITYDQSGFIRDALSSVRDAAVKLASVRLPLAG